MVQVLRETRVLVLFSGGIDSMGCLKYYERIGASVVALYVDYGQPGASQELQAARQIAADLGVRLRVVHIDGLTIPPEGFIVGRNLLLAAVAAASGTHEWDIIAFGIHSGTTYPDCSENFVRRMQDCMDVYTNGSTMVEAPFVKWRKDDVWAFVRQYGLPVERTYSCERGAEPPCGECSSCKDREALNALTA